MQTALDKSAKFVNVLSKIVTNKDYLCSTHMQDLQEVTQDLHYENFRSERLKRGGRLSSHGYILPLSPAYVLLCLSFTTSSPASVRKADFWGCIIWISKNHEAFVFKLSSMPKKGFRDMSFILFLLQQQVNGEVLLWPINN